MPLKFQNIFSHKIISFFAPNIEEKKLGSVMSPPLFFPLGNIRSDMFGKQSCTRWGFFLFYYGLFICNLQTIFLMCFCGRSTQKNLTTEQEAFLKCYSSFQKVLIKLRNTVHHRAFCIGCFLFCFFFLLGKFASEYLSL